MAMIRHTYNLSTSTCHPNFLQALPEGGSEEGLGSCLKGELEQSQGSGKEKSWAG